MRRLTYFMRKVLPVVGAAGALACLGLVGRANYPLFHVLTEGFCVVVAYGIFVIAWNAPEQARAGYLAVLGSAFLFVGGMDFVHALSYKGSGVLLGIDQNAMLQLWIASRAMEALSFLGAFAFLKRRLPILPLLGAFAAATALALASIFWWRIFPVCLVEGQGPTLFKQVSQYAIIAVMATAMAMLLTNRERFDRSILRWIAGAIAMRMAAEYTCTLYTTLDGQINLAGHLLKLAAFYLIYRAFIHTGIRRPFDLLFRDLRQSHLRLQRARQELEARVEQRTADLTGVVGVLNQERQKLFSVLNLLPGYVALKDRNYGIRFANHTFLDVFSVPAQRPCHEVQRGVSRPCEDCSLKRVLETRQPQTAEKVFANQAERRVFQVSQYPFTDADGSELVLELGMDITERRELERRVLRISEIERRRLGENLHDSLGQKLTGLAFLIEGLSRKLAETHPEDLKTAAQINDAIRESISQVRAIAKGLDPVGLSGGGFLAALADLAAHARQAYGIDCDFSGPQELDLKDETVAAHLFYIAEEAILRASKVGKAKKVHIVLENEGEGAILLVQDDGQDPPPREPGGAGGDGTGTMRYRASAIHGTLIMERDPGGGTTVRCRVPGLDPWKGRTPYNA